MINKINIIDIETFGKDVVPYCCCIIFNGKRKVFYSLKCIVYMLEWVLINCPSNTIFFAHNLTFDGLVIINNMGDKFKIKNENTLLRNCDIYSICIENVIGKCIIFKCSYKILPLSLEDIANRFNIEKKLNIEHKDINKDNYMNSEIMHSVIKYCIRDVIIAFKFMNEIDDIVSKLYPGWWLRIYSISGLALKIFSKNFNINGFFNLDIKGNLDDLIRPSYYGGRCEVFGNPYEDDFIYHYDFTSMYTNRLTELYPYGNYIYSENKKIVDDPGFYYIEVESNIEDIPILPYRCNITKKLLFPNGLFSGLYWYEEIILFLENGGKVLNIKWSVTFEKQDYIFKNFAIFCTENRKKSDINNILWKLIPNSFIGRLGLKINDERTFIINNNDYDPISLDVIKDRSIGNQYIVKIKEKINKTHNGNVIYPAIITSKARILWWKSAKKLIENGGRILYCDTDSIFVAYKKNILNQKHGNIKWIDNGKDTVIQKACFAGNKIYSVIINNKTITKIKGISRKESNKMTFEEFYNFFHKNKNIDLDLIMFNKKNWKMSILDIKKVINFSCYDKRIFYAKKKLTKPIYIDTLYNEWGYKNRINE